MNKAPNYTFHLPTSEPLQVQLMLHIRVSSLDSNAPSLKAQQECLLLEALPVCPC